MNAPSSHSDERLRRSVEDLLRCARGRDARSPRLSRLAAPDAIVQRRLSGGCTGFIRGWQVIVSLVTYGEDSVREWHASAMLYPRGRSSTERDWAVLGQIVGATGATNVEDQLRAQATTTHPSAPQHWHWTEQG